MRLRKVRRIEQARTSGVRIAEQLGISRTTVHTWLTRHRHEGDAGLLDRTSRPP
ncbi:helix-turn-helix domain-containing protein [Umezawaea endophytica]|uniref:helix-turn-helix domain-containing protein n=1 Tax=Umezawaea endophytica TaxID=1654476 RepID=UPI003558E5E3